MPKKIRTFCVDRVFTCLVLLEMCIQHLMLIYRWMRRCLSDYVVGFTTSYPTTLPIMVSRKASARNLCCQVWLCPKFVRHVDFSEICRPYWFWNDFLIVTLPMKCIRFSGKRVVSLNHAIVYIAEFRISSGLFGDCVMAPVKAIKKYTSAWHSKTTAPYVVLPETYQKQSPFVREILRSAVVQVSCGKAGRVNWRRTFCTDAKYVRIVRGLVSNSIK